MEFVDNLHANKVPTNSVKSILGDMYGDEQNVPMTSKDLKNRYGGSTYNYLIVTFLHIQ